MYRRFDGLRYNAADLSGQQDSPPPDWDLLDLFNIDFTTNLSTPCVKEKLIPAKMALKKIVQTTSAIGSTLWMEDEIKPVTSVLDSFEGLQLPEGFTFESLASGRGLNTPPPLPVLSELSDYITEVDKQETGQDFTLIIKKNEETGGKFSPFGGSNSLGSPLDPRVENTVNLHELFVLQDLAVESDLLGDLSPSLPRENLKQLYTLQQQQQLLEDTAASAGTEEVFKGSEAVYLPSFCQEEQVEETIEDRTLGTQLLNSSSSVGDSCLSPTDSVITISVEDFERLTGGCDLLKKAGLVLGGVNQLSTSSTQPKALPIRRVNQPKTSQSGAAVQEEEQSLVKTQPNERKNSTAGNGSRKRRIASLDKCSDEYKDKRARNNESVRKSRDKAKLRQEETEGRMQLLSAENHRLQDRVDSLEKELSILRGLFSSTATPL